MGAGVGADKRFSKLRAITEATVIMGFAQHEGNAHPLCAERVMTGPNDCSCDAPAPMRGQNGERGKRDSRDGYPIRLDCHGTE